MKNHNMDPSAILLNYDDFKEAALKDRFFKHKHIEALLEQLPAAFDVNPFGYSFENRSLELVKWGEGPVKVFLWSQMHGNEATGTMALFDLFNYLQQDNENVQLIRSNCTLYCFPMVNPDGAERFIRRNAQQIDINRDFHKTVSPEAKLLKELRGIINPKFGFNLHDQSTLWSVRNTGKPATLSYLAPAFDESCSMSSTRRDAMLVIADIFSTVSTFLPKQIGLFDDEYEPRAFGDNFQEAGTSTILIEAGGLNNDDENQEIRKYFFLSILSGLTSIASQRYLKQGVNDYLVIPPNNKEIFHILIRNIELNGIKVSIGINYEEMPYEDGSATVKYYSIQDIGDMDILHAYAIYNAEGLRIEGTVTLYQNANFSLFEEEKIILSFKNGIIQSKR